MIKIRIASAGVLAVALLAGTCFAEDAPPVKFYMLDFVVKEVEGGKMLNSRNYSFVVSNGKGADSGMIRTGSKIPYSTGKENTYLDVGVNIDCRWVKETPGGLTLLVDADVSSVAQESMAPGNLNPVVRQNKWGSTVIVPLKKPMVIFSSDDLTSKHQMQVELTATPIT